MAPRLTDLQRKQIASDYIELGNYNTVAKMHGISDTTVKRVVEAESDILKKVADKKEENTMSILAHMETRRDKVNEIIDIYLERLLDPERIAKATPSQLTTAMGTLIDKFTMKGIKDSPAGVNDDPLSAALKALASELDADGAQFRPMEREKQGD